MKKIILSFLLFCCFSTSYAQSFDDIISKRKYIACNDVSFNASDIVHSLYKKGETDSLYSFLDYWQSKCGDLNYIRDIRILLDIKTANFDSTTINNELLYSLIAYKENQQWSRFRDSDINGEYLQLQKNIQNEIEIIATDIQQTYSTDEALLQDFYTRDSVTFTDIKKASPQNSKLKRLYDQRIHDALRIPEYHIAFLLGYYHPTQKLDVFGSHPSLGLMIGTRELRHTFDFVMDIRFGHSKDDYTFMYKGDLKKDDVWTSAYLGLEYTYDFIMTDKVRLGFSPGVAYNGVTAVTADKHNDNDAKILRGLDVSGGLAFKYTFGKNGGYMGLQTRYHWVDHRNPGGTELNGGYFSVRLIVGSIFSYDRQYRLKQLDW